MLLILPSLAQAELHGILPVKSNRFEPLQQTAVHWSNTLKQAAAVCNSLTLVNKHTVAGFDVERSLFKAVEARFLVRQEQIADQLRLVSLPALQHLMFASCTCLLVSSFATCC